jgi:hypothetical protein
MVLNGIGASSGRRPATLSRSADDQAAAAEQRALVPVPEIECREDPAPYSRRPAAPFLAQLIATARGEPQTCERRRAKPQVAAEAYRAAAELGLGKAISRKS